MYTLFGMNNDAYSEFRSSERKPIRKAVLLIIESDEPEEQFEGIPGDMPDDAPGVESGSALTAGQILNLVQPDDPSHALRCTVVWSGDISTDGNDQLGLEFLDSLSSAPKN